MAWKITYFSQKVEEDTYKFPPGILADFLHIASLIEEFGPNLAVHIQKLSETAYLK